MNNEPDNRNEEGTCDGCGLGEHPTDPCCDWHWNTPPIESEGAPDDDTCPCGRRLDEPNHDH